jgi:hypothetical protein
MKKFAMVAFVALVGLSFANANDVFKAKQENMKTKINDKLSGTKNPKALEFGKKKIACVDAAKSEQDLAVCKKQFPPQELDSLVK